MTLPSPSSSPTGPAAGPQPTRARALAALLLLVPVPSLGVAAAMFWWPGTHLGQAWFGLSKLWILLLPLVWLLAVQRQRISFSPARLGGFRPAVLLGFLMALAILGGYAAIDRAGWLDTTHVVDRARETGLASRPFFLLGALYWVTVNSLVEEYVWRWFVFRQFEVLLGPPVAVAAAALAFTAHHVLALAAQFSWPITCLGSLGVFVGGLLWSWLYSRYRSIWPGYVSHAIVDVPIFLIGYRLIFANSP